ncbi:unnamed protein product [Arabidopsis arenosa]|uniref:F-box domain-containing protein n=1 Tax=Arabidopsis arenosa TaxID=38785 RepID=A0A8S1ZNT0_ARAAE|nr:unnamed protein product [Arabidopsis arenosa]
MENSHFDSSSIMNDLPLHLLDEILFKLEPKSMAMMRCTNKSFKSYLTDPRFGPQYPSWVRSSLFNVSSYGGGYVCCQPLVSSCDYMSPGNGAELISELCYFFGSCSGLLLLYIGCLFVANPLTKRFRILDHSGSKLIPKIVGGEIKSFNDANIPGSNVYCTERAMCVGFAVNRNRTTKRFKIVCILEMETVYGFEISDGDSWRLSETTITTSSKSDLTTRMKPAYLDNTLHWLRNDGSIISFNPETEQACLISSIFHREPDTKLLFAESIKINRLTLISGTIETISVYTLVGNHKWALTRRIKNISIEENTLECWNIVAYDGKCLVVRVKKRGLESFEGVIHVYDMEANSWGVLGSTTIWASCVRDFYKFTPSLFSVEEDEQQKVLVASNDQRISYLIAIMGLIDTTK